MHGSKVMTMNTFHGDPRPSLWRCRAPADSSHIERQNQSHPQTAKTNVQVYAAFVEKLTGSRAKKRSASRDVHESSRNAT